MRGARSVGGSIAAALAAALLLAPAALAQCKNQIPARIIELAPGDKVGALTYGFQAPALRDHEVILTFDDGPNPTTTPRILDLLKQHCITATFFPLGGAAEDHPALVKREVAEGHTIGSHTYTHRTLVELPFREATKDISDGLLPLVAAGARPMLFRFPALGASPELLTWLREHGMAVVSADVDPWDWAGDPPQETLKRLKLALDEKGRGIILLHDTQENTLKLLPALIDYLSAHGYRVVRLTGAVPGRQIAG